MKKNNMQGSSSDADERSSKRRKSHGKATASSPAAAESGSGMDWIDEALAVGGGKGGGDASEELTAAETAAKARDEVKERFVGLLVELCGRDGV